MGVAPGAPCRYHDADCTGEFPAAAWEAHAVQGPFGFAQGRLFDFGTASLRESVPALRMTEVMAIPRLDGSIDEKPRPNSVNS